ncbi:MAG: hypothetical protein AAF609_17610 [Cyanobacteria bacterium P01_C01_bin.120]
MYRSSISDLSAGDRWMAGLMAAGITFVVGYTITRVSLIPTETANTNDVQLSVVPHEGELWTGFAE